MVKKGSWWICKFENEDHILLWDGGDVELTISTVNQHYKDFEDFNYITKNIGKGGNKC